jgi:hypothetical protein
MSLSPSREKHHWHFNCKCEPLKERKKERKKKDNDVTKRQGK